MNRPITRLYLVVLALFGYELDGSHDHDRNTADG